jgi:hypothetical protein
MYGFYFVTQLFSGCFLNNNNWLFFKVKSEFSVMFNINLCGRGMQEDCSVDKITMTAIIQCKAIQPIVLQQ